jgi:malate synthase
VPLHGLMEDAATAEISRAQVWQWRRHGARLADGRTVDAPLVRQVLAAELAAAERAAPDAGAAQRLCGAAELLEPLLLSDELADFLTLAAYPAL